jgi:tetraacyldisaccharide 4'-kinase
MSNRLLRYILSPVLLPASLAYGLVVYIRNKLFDLKILRSVKFDLPVISVGNITVGGTGKTPHVEYILNLLSDKVETAMLSRGYKRKSVGFRLADEDTQSEEIGDEAFQVFSKFNNVHVAVDADRVEGIGELTMRIKNLQAVVLDDAFQHRYVKPDISIALIDFNRPVFKDFLLPLGNLREGVAALHRADVVIVTKAPENFLPVEEETWKKKLKLNSKQELFFSWYEYDDLTPVYGNPDKKIKFSTLLKKSTEILLFTGIANPKPLKEYLNPTGLVSIELQYPDHHAYTQYDIKNILNKYLTISSENKILITTEKDAVKLRTLSDLPPSLTENTFYLPVRVKFPNKKKEEFDSKILDVVVKKK